MIPLRKTIFWDVDVSVIDMEEHAHFIICRIFERGSWREIVEAIKFYNRERVIESLLSAEYLRDSALKMAAVLFELRADQFKCYTKKQLRPNY